MNNVVQFRGIFRNNKLTPVRRFYKVVAITSARQLYSTKMVSCAVPLWSACLALVQFSREHVSVPVATFPIYGSKAAGREKSALNVLTSPSLKESPCPNHSSYRLGSFTQLDIYVWGTCTRIFTFLGPFLRA